MREEALLADGKGLNLAPQRMVHAVEERSEEGVRLYVEDVPELWLELEKTEVSEEEHLHSVVF